MFHKKRVNDFALKWRNKFRDPKVNEKEILAQSFKEECEALGFKIINGNPFGKYSRDAFANYEELDKIIDEVSDVHLLGCAIYSKWEHFNMHHLNEGVLEPQNMSWIIVALNRLVMLTLDDSGAFKGTLDKIRIISNNCHFGPIPGPDEEVEQRLTITSDGNVKFEGYNNGCGKKKKKIRSKHIKLVKLEVERLFKAFTETFNKEHEEVLATDIGSWNLELTNSEGDTYVFKGSLCADFKYDGCDLSQLVRNVVRMNDLFVFNEHICEPINRVVINYHRESRVKLLENENDTEGKIVTWDYKEQLIIDRETETLEHIQMLDEGRKIYHKYEIEGDISSMLNGFGSNDLFSVTKGNPKDVKKTPNESIDYTITITYENNSIRFLTGTFDKNGLPEDFTTFIEKVFSFIAFYGVGEMFEKRLYGKAKRRECELIYCSVIFYEGAKKSYYYLTDDDFLDVGDFVIVNAGDDNHEAFVKIVNIEYFTKDNVPLPVEQTKRIVRKCTKEDYEAYEKAIKEAKKEDK